MFGNVNHTPISFFIDQNYLSQLILICRRCNCDVGDNKVRFDAGVLRYVRDLPLERFMTQQSEDGCYTKLTLGNMYCAEEELGKLIAKMVEASC